jgi:FkbM family methyltransferase
VDKTYYSLNDLDRKLEPYVDYDNGYYIELGANDGVKFSNTAYFDRHRGWRGVLIEPAPHKFLACLRNRGDRNAVFCAACVGFDYADRFVEMRYANMMSVALNLESDLKSESRHLEVAQKHMRDQEVIFNFGALARTLTSILEEAGAPRDIDFLSLDVEGAEIAVLKGLDLDKYRIKYLLVECRDLNKMKAYLDGHGYDHVDQLARNDALFRRREMAQDG